MAFDATAVRRDLVAQLRASARPPKDPDRAQSYLGSPVPVLGVPVPKLRAIVSAFRRAHRDLMEAELIRLASPLWDASSFEEKALAISLVDAYPKILGDASWRLLDRWVDDASGWGLCDWLGLGPIASIVRARPERFADILRWTKSKNHWRRRIAVYAVHDFVFAGELDEPFQVLERLLYDEEFWVQRAVGTWLRESWKKDRTRTEAFLRSHVRGLPKVVITVATERAPKALRDELRANR